MASVWCPVAAVKRPELGPIRACKIKLHLQSAGWKKDGSQMNTPDGQAARLAVTTSTSSPAKRIKVGGRASGLVATKRTNSQRLVHAHPRWCIEVYCSNPQNWHPQCHHFRAHKERKQKRRSGVILSNPFTPSLNHTRKCTSLWFRNTDSSTSPIPAIWYPQLRWSRPPLTETDTLPSGSDPLNWYHHGSSRRTHPIH